MKTKDALANGRTGKQTTYSQAQASLEMGATHMKGKISQETATLGEGSDLLE